MEKYQYTPLPPGYSAIRLVRLQPGRPGTVLQIEIFHAKLPSNPAYEALSYSWGRSNRTHVVRVQKEMGLHHFKRKKHENTSTLGIAENLFIALQHLRHSSESRILWIDAISINQDDMDERSTEVLEMGSIYKNARQVLVWLGPSSRNSDLALQTLKRIGEAVTNNPEERWIKSHPGTWPDTLDNDTEALASHANCWLAVKEILTREWFSRLWVFQEITLARKASLVVSENCLDWGIFVLGLRWIRSSGGQLDRLIQHLDISNLFSNAIWPFLESSLNPTSKELLPMLQYTRSFRCSDPRDRLYAIRALLHPEYNKLIVPDYSSSVEEVYTNFAKEWLLQLDDAEFLRYCNLSPSFAEVDLPSWAPDWRGTEDIDFNSRCSGASQGFSTVDGNSLGIQGVLVGCLNYVTPPAEALGTEAKIREICREWRQLVSSGEYMRGESNMDVSFVEMIVGGLLSEKQPSIRKDFASLEEIKTFLAESAGIDKQIINSIITMHIRRAIQGRLLLMTTEGHFGLGPRSAKPGDRVAVILGCGVPLILRPDDLSGRDCFRVVGPCYISDIMYTEALLGPLPPGWSVRHEKLHEGDGLIFTNRDIHTQRDPRMPLLPYSWEYRYGDAAEEVEAEKLKDMKKQWFENVETRKTTYGDPRLTPELLRKGGGVAIEKLILT
ncbi:uncharacterized protein PAC_18372 [Phialocephala subalpina]|uniref:Heterokaryon incompatibility domain-containing protein n=1 Tax=Phialocephala subalpina TaxID=576137 RepID=A0A1L7XTU8_9HELO|nr:uncharacterized protein PAC_18372 [Phialocephala subalpina]